MLIRLIAALALVFPPLAASAATEDRPPNVVVIFTDDQGYADVGVFGAEGFETPQLDRMAAEGRTFTNFYAAQAVCSASRAALLTGCYPNRIGIIGALGPGAKTGLNSNEVTMAEMLKPLGYATAIFGKWHLGDDPQFLPTRHGFDEYFGLPYSNDMWPNHPTAGDRYPPLPLIEGEEVIALNPDQRNLTTWYTERAVSFIERNQDQPFFLYVPHSMPHVPLFVSDKFEGKSEQGLYGDVIMEIDWSVGQILDTLRRLDLSENTLVVFTSDNGPWLSYGNHAGSAGPLREGKGTTFDGGQREPTIAWWPGRVPAGTSTDEPAMTIDLLPTIAAQTGASLPDHPIDGLDISPLLLGEPDAQSPHDALYFYWGRELQAVRSGPWKLHLPHEFRSLEGQGGSHGQPAPYIMRSIGLALFNLDDDLGESTDVKADHPEVVERLQALVDRARADLGDSSTQQQGSGVRPPGRL
ncbi:sulfatase family protein [Tautonia marina]|uniref:sulfatase family protein n=1 Tax=Tautonia marina TaxID=2653855 RepID=UPI001260A1F7|nr:sulfatase [Tautonia marina]